MSSIHALSSVVDPRKVLRLKNGLQVYFTGHRGEGTTDSPASQQRDFQERRLRFPENTVQSQRQCLLYGANGFELDAIQTLDNHIVCTHADEVGQHILVDYTPPQKYIGRMRLYQVREIPVGPHGAGRIALLEDTLLMVKHEFPGAVINVELKGKIGNLEDSFQTSPGLSELVLEAIKKVDYPMSDIMFSSFSHRYLMDMAKLCPEARLGILYEPPQHASEPLYGGAEGEIDQCAALTMSYLEKTLQLIPSLYSVHPEISYLTEENVRWMQDKGLKLHVWALKEISPSGPSEKNQQYAASIIRAVNLAHNANMTDITFITGNVQEIHALLVSHNL